MECFDCKGKAETYLINGYEKVLPLCHSCLDEYIQLEGEINLDFYSIEITGVGQYEFIKRINEVLKYLNKMNEKYSDRYFKAKKLADNPDHGDFLSAYLLKDALDWYNSSEQTIIGDNNE